MNTFIFYLGSTWDYIAQMLPCMLVAAVLFFLLNPQRKRRLATLGLKSGLYRECGLFLFILFCAGLGALTLFPRSFWSYGHWYWVLKGEEPVFAPVDFQVQLQNLQLIPFWEISIAFTGSWHTYMLLGNMIMFAPIGFFTALLWREPRWWKSLLAGAGASLFVETVQFFIGRSSDIDDVILNSFGALCGFWVFCLLRFLAPRFTQAFHCTRMEVPHGRETGDNAASA